MKTMRETYRRAIAWSTRSDPNTYVAMVVLLSLMMISVVGIHSFLPS